MEREEYFEEVQLIKEQNNVEFEIYPMAVDIIQPTIKNWSKRYVFARRRSACGQIYYGISSFPDVVILDKSFKNIPNKKITDLDWKKLKGCLEVKKLEDKLITKEEIEGVLKQKSQPLNPNMGQLLGEILWYKKVIYTNGIEWRFLYIEEYTKELQENVINTVNERIESERNHSTEEFVWWKNFKEIDFKIIDKCITKNCLEDWESFITEINKITWD